jgi:hypothetical protein
MGIVRSAIRLVVVVAACVFVATAAGKPLTKQNGKSPAFTGFTSICTLPPYLFYGFCGGNSSTFTNVTSRMNAVQAKPGRYNLEFSFSGLTPGGVYRFWGNNGAFFVIGTDIADGSGSVDFDYQTTSPAGLGFDLNFIRGGWDVNGITIVTSYWSNQLLSVHSDGTLSAG